MQHTFYDLIIVGAGPAGCSSALNLADSGLKVALVDKTNLPGEKICGDALSGNVLNVLKRFPGNCYSEFLKLEPKSPSWGIRFAAPNGELLDIPFILEKSSQTQPPGYLCKRMIFDGFLQKKVREISQFDIISNFRVKDIQRENNAFTLVGENDMLNCRMLLGADGYPSMVGKKLDHSPNPTRISLGVRAYFTGVKDTHPEQFIELHFLETLLPGYLWIFPMADGITNVGLGVLSDKKKLLPGSLSDLLINIIHSDPAFSERFGKAEMIGKIEAHGLPLGPHSMNISGEGYLLAGDAASLVDPFSGEGIGNAMVSGEIAAGTIREAFERQDFSSGFMVRYDERIRKKMWRELKTSQRLQDLCTHPTLFNLVVKKANRNPELKNMFTKMYTSQDIRDQLKSPGFYLRLLMG